MMYAATTFWIEPQYSARKRKDQQMGLHETKELPHSKENSQTEEAAYRIGAKSLPAIHLTRD
jgi:hypothetical protein